MSLMRFVRLSIPLLLVSVLALAMFTPRADASGATLNICPSTTSDANNYAAAVGLNVGGVPTSYKVPSLSAPSVESTTRYFGTEWIWRDFYTSSGSNLPQGEYPGVASLEATAWQARKPVGTDYDFSNSCSFFYGADTRDGLSVHSDVHDTQTIPRGAVGRYAIRAPLGNPNNPESVGYWLMSGYYGMSLRGQTGANGGLFNNSIYTSKRPDNYCFLAQTSSGISAYGLSFVKGATGVGRGTPREDSWGIWCDSNYTISSTQVDPENKLRNTFYMDLRCVDVSSSCNNYANTKSSVNVNDLKLLTLDNENPGIFVDTLNSTVQGKTNLLAPGWQRGLKYARYSAADSGHGLDVVNTDMPGDHSSALNIGEECLNWDPANRSAGQIKRYRENERNRYDLSLVQGHRSTICPGWYFGANYSINTYAEYGNTSLSTINFHAWDFDRDNKLFGGNYGTSAKSFLVDNAPPDALNYNWVSASPKSTNYISGTMVMNMSGRDTASKIRAFYPMLLNTADSTANSAYNYMMSQQSQPGSTISTKTAPSVDLVTETVNMARFLFPGCQDQVGNGHYTTGCSFNTKTVPDGTQYRILGRGVDNAGNAKTYSNPASMTRTVDNTPPALSTTLPDSVNWFADMISIPVTANDPTSGLKNLEYCYYGSCTWTPIDLPTTGAKNFTTTIQVNKGGVLLIRAVDVAGNTSATGEYLAINLKKDDTPPTLTISGDSTSWTNNPYLALRSVDAQDHGSGMNKLTWDYISGQSAGDPDAGCIPQPDTAAWGGSTDCGYLNPIFAEHGQSAPVNLGEALWLGQPVSGVRASGTREMTATAFDLAGNQVTRQFTAKLDFQDPTINLPVPAGIDLDNFTLNASSTDAHSGPSGLTYQICAIGPGCETAGDGSWTELNQTMYTTDVCRENMLGDSASPRAYPCQIRLAPIEAGPDDKIYVRAVGNDLAGNQGVSNVREIEKRIEACPRLP